MGLYTKITPAKYLLVFFLIMLGVLAGFYFLGQSYRSGVNYCLSPNEGWNAFFAMAAVEGHRLYPLSDSLITNNYPPLSFYLTGLLGELLGDHIAAGRLFSLLATLGITAAVAGIIRRLGGGNIGMIAGAGLFLTTICKFYDYVGQDDPQLLAQAIMSLSTFCFLKRYSSGRSLILPVVGMVIAGFFKHNIIAMPVAAMVWLFLRDRQKSISLAALALVLSVAGLTACRYFYGTAFLYNFSTPRGFFMSQGMDSLPDFFRHSALPVVISLGMGVTRWRDPRFQFVNLLLGVSLFSFFFESCGDGVGPNAEFDVVIASSIGFGMTVGLLKLPASSRFLSRDFAAALLILVALVSFLPEKEELAVRLLLDSRQVAEQRKLTESAMEDAVARCRAMPGDVYCDPTVLYRAGKPFTIDSYNTGERIRYGRIPANAIEALYKSGRLSFVENPYNYLDDSWYPY